MPQPWFLSAGAWVQVSPSPELQEGQAVVLSCQVPTGISQEASYLWFRDGRPLHELTSATLRIPAITLKQAGAYHCQVQAPGSAITLAAPVSLHVSCKGMSHPWVGRGCIPWSWLCDHNRALWMGDPGQALTIPHPHRCPTPGQAHHLDGRRPRATGPYPMPCGK